MPPYNKALKTFQSGRESAKGTAVAATSRMMIEDMTFDPASEAIIRRPALLKGQMVANRGNELRVHNGFKWAIPETPVVFDQFMAYLAMALKGGVAPTGAGPYVWDYTPAVTALPAQDSRTFEIRQTDGATPSDWESPYCMLQHLEISGAVNDPIKFSANGFGRKLVTSTLTPAIAVPASIVLAPFALGLVKIDANFGALGTTTIAGQVLGFKFSMDTGLYGIDTADARADMDFTLDAIDVSKVKAQMEIVMLAIAGGQWATEKTAAEAGVGGTLRAVDLDINVSASARLRLGGIWRYSDGSVFPDADREGQQIVTLKLESTSDDTNWIRAILTNNASAMV